MKKKHEGSRLVAFGLFLLLMFVYWIFGKLTQTLMIEPHFGVPIWPSAGIAIAGLLVFGIRFWPAIFIASLLLKCEFNFSNDSNADVLWSLFTNAIIATGATLEAVIGAWLVRRYSKFPHRLDRSQDILLQLFYGAILVAPISAILGPVGLLLNGVLAPGELFTNAIVWWFGDVLGVVLVLPPVSGWLSELRGMSWRVKAAVAIPPMVLLIASIAAFGVAFHAENNAVHEAFVERANSMHITLQQQLLHREDLVLTLAGFMEEEPGLSREAFARVAQPYLKDQPGTQAVEWIPNIRNEERDEFESRAHLDGLSDFVIAEIGEGGTLVPAGTREEYFPVYYVEPLPGNEAAVGFDLASNQRRLDAIKRAQEVRGIALSEPVTLVQETAGQAGVLMFAPVFKEGDGPLKGLVLFVFRAGALLSEAMAAFPQHDVQFQVKDVGANQSLLATNIADGLFDNPERAISVPLVVGGREWTFSCAPTNEFVLAQKGGESVLVFVCGLLVTVMFGSVLLVLAGRNSVTQQLVYERTAELRKEIGRRRRIQADREEVIKELEAALSDIHTLEGLLPICASCKKIREDSGDWTNIESYITQRSEADFSHSICPECMKTLYPKYSK